MLRALKHKVDTVVSSAAATSTTSSSSMRGSASGASSSSTATTFSSSLTTDLSSSQQLAVLVFFIITILLAFAAVFALIKDFLLRSSTKFTRPVYSQVLSELAVLGFLVVILIVVTYGTGLRILSTTLFSAPFYITSQITTLQYLLIMVMVLIFLQFLYLAHMVHAAAKRLAGYEAIVTNTKDISERVRKIGSNYADISLSEWVCDYLCSPIQSWKRYTQRNEEEDLLVYYGIRKEFVCTRNLSPPFQVGDQAKWLPADFDFAAYLSGRVSRFMTDAASYGILTYAALFPFLSVFFAVAMLSGSITLVDALVWLLLGYLDLILLVALKSKAQLILMHLVNPSSLRFDEAFPKPERVEENNESSPLLSRPENLLGAMRRPMKKGAWVKGAGANSSSTSDAGSASDDSEAGPSQPTLSAATSSAVTASSSINSLVLRIRSIPGSQPLWTTLLNEDRKHKQATLFWFGRPSWHVFLFKLHVLIFAIYFTVATALYIPYLFATYDVWVGVLYTFFSMLPLFIELLALYTTMFVPLAQVASVGIFRNHALVSEVSLAQRSEKMARFYRTVTLIGKSLSYEGSIDPSDAKYKSQVDEIARLFGGSASLTKDEVSLVLSSLGADVEMALAELDPSGVGKISRDQFVLWWLSEQDGVAISPRDVFASLTSREEVIASDDLRRKMNAVAANVTAKKITDDDVAAVVSLLDPNETGRCSEKDFETLYTTASSFV